MSYMEMRVGGDKSQGPLWLWVALIVGLVAWLFLIWLGADPTVLRVKRDDLLPVAAWGVAIVFGGLFLVYTWTVVTAIVARERLRSTLKRGMSLADQALAEARQLDATRAE